MQRKESVGAVIWRYIYPLLIFLGAECIIETVVLLIYVIQLYSSGGISIDMDVQALTNDMINYVYDKSLYMSMARGAILVPVYILLLNHDKKRDKQLGRYEAFSSYKKTWLILLPVVGAIAALGFNNVVSLTGIASLSKAYQKVEGIVYSGGIAVQILAAAVIAPAVEELLFRGMIYKRLRYYLKPIPSMIISAAVFGLIHGNLVQFVYAFLVGVLLAFVYEKFKTIIAPMLFHAGANLISVIITNIGVLNGLEFSIGGYMLLTVVLLAVTFLLLWVMDMKVDRQVICDSDNNEM